MIDPRLWSSRKGTSLVEILVVMVILIVGILSVIQLFSPGLNLIRTAENRTIATRLAQRELERWKQMSENLPDAIVPCDEEGNIINLQITSTPYKDFAVDSNGDIFEQAGTPAKGNAYNLRQVIGERVVAPDASEFKTGAGPYYGCRYDFGFAPIQVQSIPGGLEGLSVRTPDFYPVPGNSADDPGDLELRPDEFGIDLNAAGSGAIKIAFPVEPSAVDRVFYVTFSYWATDGAVGGNPVVLMTKPDQPVVVPADYEGDWMSISPDVSGRYSMTGLIPESITVSRAFSLNTGDWTDNPYEYKLADEILGTVVLNPNAAGMEVRFDYRILDPRILREDRSLPAAQNGEISVKLPLRFILDAGLPGSSSDGTPTDNPNEESFEGLIPSLGVTDSIMIFDLETGLRVDLASVSVDFKSGIVYLPESAGLVDFAGNAMENVVLSGRYVRFLYRADGDWVLQCDKANGLYTSASGPTYMSFTQSAGSNRLLFAPCDAMKSVVVDYTFAGAAGEKRRAGESYQIDLDTLTGEWCVDLPIDSGTEINRVAVAGSSFRSRILWRDGKNWRNVELESSVVRRDDK